MIFEKITGSQLVKKLLAFYGNRKFITAITTARHLSLSLVVDCILMLIPLIEILVLNSSVH